MSFADQIRKIQIPRMKGKYSALEVLGDPESLAMSFSEFKSENESHYITKPWASSIYDSCMRKQVIGTVFKLSESKWIGLREKLAYGIGIAVHYHIQNSSILFGDRRYGWWQCTACGKIRYFGGPPKSVCEKCGARSEATVYFEHRMKLTKPLIVSGRPDMFFNALKIKKMRVAEIKTINGEEYEKLVAPVISHVWQIHTYMWGCSIDASLPVEIDSSVGYVVYVTKRATKGSFPLKIFPVFSNPDLLKRIKAKLNLYKQGLMDYPKNIPPPIEECQRSKFEGYRAKQCQALKECLSNLSN
jgi:hypothetical protein